VYVQNNGLNRLDVRSTALHGDGGAEQEDGQQPNLGLMLQLFDHEAGALTQNMHHKGLRYAFI